MTLNFKKFFRRCSSSSDIYVESVFNRIGDYDEVFDDNIFLILVIVKLIFNNIVKRFFDLNCIDISLL